MEQFIDQMMRTVGDYLPALVGALLILVLGWLVALITSSGVRKLLNRTTIDNRLTAWLGPGKDRAGYHVEAGIAAAVYYLMGLYT